jgi:Ca2+/H+ antiporter
VVDYEQILKDKEQKFVELSRENADLASTWVRLKSWFWWGVWIFVIGFILTILAQALPPPANSIAAIVAFPIGLLIKIIKGIIPSATKFAGVVSENVHNEIKSAAEQMVLSINELKTKNPVAYEETKNILKDKTDINSRAVIIDIKKENKLI